MHTATGRVFHGMIKSLSVLFHMSHVMSELIAGRNIMTMESHFPEIRLQ